MENQTTTVATAAQQQQQRQAKNIDNVDPKASDQRDVSRRHQIVGRQQLLTTTTMKMTPTKMLTMTKLKMFPLKRFAIFSKSSYGVNPINETQSLNLGHITCIVESKLSIIEIHFLKLIFFYRIAS